MSRRLALSYVLPLRWSADQGLAELRRYLGRLAGLVEEVIVVDGSPPAQFERNAAALCGLGRHLAPHPDLAFAYGKVNGVTTGMREARCARVVLADDDIRYGEEELRRLAELLDRADLVRPQNYFRPLVWHARWDTARSLLNRVFSGDLDSPAADFPGTLGLRREAWEAIGGYDGNLLFENLELIRTIRCAGGTVLSPLDLYVARRPPTAHHFFSQRVRQAYDDFALPLRLAAFLSAGPLALAALLQGRRSELALAALGLVAVAETGRRRAGGARVFPASASLLAPGWVCERALCAWLALASRLRHGGVRYADGVISRAGSRPAELRARYASLSLRTERGGGALTGALSASKPTTL